MRGPLVQLRRIRRSFIGGLTAAVLATVLLAVPALAAGTLGLTPSQGVSGDGFQVSGGGFEASEKVKLKWDGKGFGSPVRTDANGAFTTTRSVPVDAPGKYIVSATGLQSGLKAEAIFTIIEPAATTTTTTTTSPSTTTTVGETTTTAAVGETTTTAAVGETTTTAADGEATTTTDGKTSSIAADGETTSIAADGETTSTAADGETTTTTDGKTTTTDSNTTTDNAGWLVTADDNSTGTGFEFFDNSGLGDVLITPIGLASAVGVPLFGVLAVWWMWRRPSDDEEESSEFGDQTPLSS